MCVYGYVYVYVFGFLSACTKASTRQTFHTAATIPPRGGTSGVFIPRQAATLQTRMTTERSSMTQGVCPPWLTQNSRKFWGNTVGLDVRHPTEGTGAAGSPRLGGCLPPGRCTHPGHTGPCPLWRGFPQLRSKRRPGHAGGLNHPILPRGLRRIRRAPPRESSAQSPRRFRGLPRSPRRT